MHLPVLTRPKSHRKKLFNLHIWVGFHLAVIMSVVLSTGTLATLSNEIDWLIFKEMRVTPATEKVSWQAMTDALQAYAPRSSLLGINNSGGDYLPYRAFVKDEYGNTYFIHLNQWTGEVTGHTGRITVQRVLRDLHRYLFMPSVIGLPIVASMAFILLISLYTGLKTSRNWKTLMTRVRIDKGTRVLIGDAHKAAGLWSIWFIILISITGIWYLAELTANVNAFVNDNPELKFQPEVPVITDQRVSDMGRIIESPKTNAIILAARSAFPEIKDSITAITYPSNANKPIIVYGTRDNPILRSRANRVFLDPTSLEVIEVQRSENLSWAAWLNEIADPLHFGTWGGLITKTIWFIFGLALTSLSITGVYLTWKRLKNQALSRTQFATLPVLFIALISAYFYWYPIFEISTKPHHEIKFSADLDEQLTIAAFIELNKKNQSKGDIRILIEAQNGNPNIDSVSLQLKNNNKKITDKKQAKLEVFSKISTFKTKLKFEGADELVISIDTNNGESFVRSWPIDI